MKENVPSPMTCAKGPEPQKNGTDSAPMPEREDGRSRQVVDFVGDPRGSPAPRYRPETTKSHISPAPGRVVLAAR